MGALTHCDWTIVRHLHRTKEYLLPHQEETMSRQAKKFDMLYLFQPEDSTVPAYRSQPASTLTEICKSILWVSVSFVLAAGISQLS